MTGEKGIVLLQALVIVLAMAAGATALLARGSDRLATASAAQSVETRRMALDALTDLAIRHLAAAGRDGAPVHTWQDWAAPHAAVNLEQGTGTIAVVDLQGLFNINWLARPSDAYAVAVADQLFASLDLPHDLLGAIRKRLAPSDTKTEGTPVARLDDLRGLPEMTDAAFARLRSHAAALPLDARLNLNTAPPEVLRAALHPFPRVIRDRALRALRRAPISHLSDLRNDTIAHLGTETIDHLPFNRFSLSSHWFQAELRYSGPQGAGARRVVLHRRAATDLTPSVALRWDLWR